MLKQIMKFLVKNHLAQGTRHVVRDAILVSHFDVMGR